MTRTLPRTLDAKHFSKISLSLDDIYSIIESDIQGHGLINTKVDEETSESAARIRSRAVKCFGYSHIVDSRRRHGAECVVRVI